MFRGRVWVALFLALVVAACSSDTGSTGTSASDEPATTGAATEEPAAETTSASSSDWGADVSSEDLCALATSGDIEAIVGRPLAEEPTPISSQGVATCFLNLDAESSISKDNVSVVVWPADEWEGRSPDEAYDYRYDVNVQPGGIDATEVEGLGVRANVFTASNLSWVEVLTAERVFEVQSPTVDGDQLVEIARIYADGL